MKKINKLLMLALCALTVTGCSKSNDSDSSSVSTSISSSSSSSTEDDSYWTSEQKEMMKEFCGGVLPFPSVMLSGKINFERRKDSSGQYLEITHESENFSIEEYYTALEKAGWTTIVSCNGDKVQKDKSGTKYVELTKNSANDGYDLIYKFVEEYTNTEYDWEKEEEVETVVPAHNVITCYKGFSTTTTTDTDWSDKAKNTMKDVITTTLPFISLGKLYNVSNSDSDSLTIEDLYTKDLSSEYVEKLKADGFELQEIVTQNYGAYCLTKKLDDSDDGAKINAVIYYQSGNNLTFFYEHAAAKDVDSWPTDKIKDLTTYAIPAFDLESNNEKYRMYKKNDTYYIEGNIDSTSFSSDDYIYDLKLLGLYSDDSGDYVDWGETVKVGCSNVYDDDWNLIAFSVSITKTTPSSNYNAGWPTAKINDTVSSLLNISTVSCPAFSDSLSKSVKYDIVDQSAYDSLYKYYYEAVKDLPEDYGLGEYASEEDIVKKAEELAKSDMGIKVYVYDTNFAAYSSYEKVFKNNGWYCYYDSFSNTVYEDPTGALAVTFIGAMDYDTNVGITTFFVHSGTGEEHTPSLTFEQKEYNFGIGSTETNDNVLQLSSSMLDNYKESVTFKVYKGTGDDKVDVTSQSLVTVELDHDENSNPYYKVTINDSVQNKTIFTIEATITANSKDYSDTCTVTALTAYDYSEDVALETIKAKMKNNISHTINNPTIDSSCLTANVSSTTVDDVTTLITTSFIPDGFEEQKNPNGAYGWYEATLTLDDNSTVQAQTITYAISFKFPVTLEFYVYSSNDGSVNIRVILYN